MSKKKETVVEESTVATEDPVVAPAPVVTHDGVLYSCEGSKIVLMADASMQTPGECFELAKGGECTINGKRYDIVDLKRGDKVCLEGEPVSKITATR